VALDVSTGAIAMVRGRATCPSSAPVRVTFERCAQFSEAIPLTNTEACLALDGKRSAAGLSSYADGNSAVETPSTPPSDDAALRLRDASTGFSSRIELWRFMVRAERPLQRAVLVITSHSLPDEHRCGAYRQLCGTGMSKLTCRVAAA